jgi:hypothetical protein
MTPVIDLKVVGILVKSRPNWSVVVHGELAEPPPVGSQNRMLSVPSSRRSTEVQRFLAAMADDGETEQQHPKAA